MILLNCAKNLLNVEVVKTVFIIFGKMIFMKNIYLSWLVILLANNFKAQSQLWGAASGAAECGIGSIFSIVPGNTNFASNVYLPSDYAGQNPIIELTQCSNGKLLGTTQFGGKYGSGVIFEYDPSNNTYIKKFDFDGPNGAYPHGNLVAGTNGKYYGVCYNGGTSNAGVIYEYDASTSTCIKKFDFISSTGANPGKKWYWGVMASYTE